MRRAAILVPCLTAILAGCTAAPLESFNDRELVIRGGTSFGMCMGHCVTELTIDEAEVVFTETSRDPGRFPTRTRTAELTPREWAELAALADPGDFEGLAPTLGCPDCADGGAEWVEVEHQGERRRVTFEYGSHVPQVGALVERIREIRARFR